MISNDIQELSREYPEYVQAVRRNYWWNFTALILDSSIFSFAVAMLSVETILPYFVSHLSNQSFWVGVVPALYFLGEFFPQLFGAPGPSHDHPQMAHCLDRRFRTYWNFSNCFGGAVC